MHWTKGSTILKKKKKKMKWKEQKGENHILVPGKDISSNVWCRHTAGQGTVLCPPRKRQPLTLLPTRKKSQVIRSAEACGSNHSRLYSGVASKFLAPSKGKIRRPFSHREFLVRNKSSEKESFLSTIWQHKTLQLGALWKALERRGTMDHSPKWWKMRISTFVNFPRKFTSSTPRAQILEF